MSSVKKRLTVTVDPEVYNGLYHVAGKRNISRFLERLARPIVVQRTPKSSYRDLAKDEDDAREAREWCDAHLNDIVDEAR